MSRDVPTGAATRRRSIPSTFVALLYLAFATCFVSAPRIAGAADAGASDTVQSAVIHSAELPTFRLGDAARPFGWATVIGDFNTDGSPDIAVADHVGDQTGTSYRLRFSISGQPPDDVRFESSYTAVSISVADVDRDNDLDVVVAVPLSDETVAVWLNDGHGHFTRGDRHLYSAPKPRGLIGTIESVSQSDAFDLSPRRIDDAIPANISNAVAACKSASIATRSHTRSSSFFSCLANPRAPPSPLLTLLS